MSIADSIKNARLTAVPSLSFRDNAPAQYNVNQQYQYYGDDHIAYIFEYAQYASDYVTADIQGLCEAEPQAWIRVYIRLAELVKASAAMSNNFDDYKMILVCGLAQQPTVDSCYKTADGRYWVEPQQAYTVVRQIMHHTSYIKRGSKLITMGNTWLVTNPMNMSEGGKAVIQRCNATWRYHDYYGNVCAEPFCVYPQKMRANDPDSQRSSMITKGYFDAIAQLNDATRNLRTNERMILGSSAYMLSGFSDFAQEFTDDDSSVNIVYFSLRYDEPNDAKDDMVNRVAGGKLFKWELLVSGKTVLKAGQTEQLTVQSRRKDVIVENTTEKPVSYLYSSSDDSIATVDANGLVTAVSEGRAYITVTLEQNTNVSQDYGITVEGTMTATQVVFESTIPDTLSMYETVTIAAGYYENGERTAEMVEWELSGAEKDAYTYTLNADNTITIKCWEGSVESLIITASYGDYSDYAEIWLRGL